MSELKSKCCRASWHTRNYGEDEYTDPIEWFICDACNNVCEIEEKIGACKLCGHLIQGLKEFNGKELCEQCYIGEVENPEHGI